VRPRPLRGPAAVTACVAAAVAGGRATTAGHNRPRARDIYHPCAPEGRGRGRDLCADRSGRRWRASPRSAVRVLWPMDPPYLRRPYSRACFLRRDRARTASSKRPHPIEHVQADALLRWNLPGVRPDRPLSPHRGCLWEPANALRRRRGLRQTARSDREGAAAPPPPPCAGGVRTTVWLRCRDGPGYRRDWPLSHSGAAPRVEFCVCACRGGPLVRSSPRTFVCPCP
jgi:hypothetical protein